MRIPAQTNPRTLWGLFVAALTLAGGAFFEIQLRQASAKDNILPWIPFVITMAHLSDGSPLYMRVEVPHAEVSELQGLIKQVTNADGSMEEHVVSQIKLDAKDTHAKEVIWQGAVRIEHGGEYDLRSADDLQLFLADQLWEGKHYLGRGLYKLLVIWRPGTGSNVNLTWQAPNHESETIPSNILFHTSALAHGLLGTYWRNGNWEGDPLFHQITPFLLLAGPDEQPIVPNGEFSARYTGALHITKVGEYLLRIEADDGARLILDGNILGEGLTPGQPNNFEANVDLQGGGTALRFFWRHGNEPLTPVPPSALLPVQP